ncbi:MAG: hypothetical protein ACOCQW_01035 [Halanaerobiaceae bacterium]
MGTMNLAEIIDRSFDILRKYIKTIVIYTLGFGILGIIGLILVILLVFLFGAMFSDVLDSLLINNSSDLSIYLFVALLGSFYFFIIAIFTSSYQVGIVRITGQEFLDRRYYADKAIKTAFKAVFKVFGIIFTGFVLFIPVFVLFFAMIYFLTPIIDELIMTSTLTAGEIILIIVLFLLALTAVLFIFTYVTFFAFSIPALTIEKTGVIQSIKRSFYLVKDKFWRLLGIIVLFGLIVYAINLSLQSLIGLITGICYLLMKLINIEIDYLSFVTTVYNYTNWPLILINWFVITPISSIMITLLYFNRRFEKEGYDIMLKLIHLEKKEEREQSIDSSTTTV